MITLDPTLQAAQDGDIHQPIIDIVSSQFNDAIPFDGQLFNTGTTDETKPAVTTLSSGRIAGIITRNDDDLVYLYTDTTRTEWNEVAIYTNNLSAGLEASLCELSDGNVGVVFRDGYTLKSMTISQTGEVVSAAQTIASYNWISSPSVIKLDDDTYMMAAAYKDGSDNYSILIKTSADFASWAADSFVSPSGLDATLRIDNTNLMQLSGGDLVLSFDYQESLRDDGSEIVNCYMMIFSGSWGSPQQITDYDVYGSVGMHPVIAEMDNGDIRMAFYESIDVLHMTADTEGFQNSGGISCSDMMSVTGAHFDSSTEKLYVICTYASGGTKALCSIVVVDVPTWTIYTCYTVNTTPAYSEYFLNSHNYGWRHHNEGKYVAVGNGKHLVLVDTGLDTIVHYNFDDNSTYSLSKNIDADIFNTYSSGDIHSTWLDISTGRLYVQFVDDYLYAHSVWVGYIDVTETADPISGEYTWNEVFKTTSYSSNSLSGIQPIVVVPDENFIIISSGSSTFNAVGFIGVHSMDDGAQLYYFNFNVTPGFHYNGAYYPIYSDGHIYAGTVYESTNGNGDRYGLMDITLSTGAIVYYRPSWATKDDYGLNQKVDMGDGRILIGCSDGIAVFDTSGFTWELLDNESVPNMVPEDDYYIGVVAYDEVSDTIFAGCYHSAYADWEGILAFSENGSFTQLKYKTGTYGTGWTFDEAQDLSVEMTAYEPVIAIDSDDVMWALWTNRDVSELSTKWDKDDASLDLVDYLTGVVTVKWDIAGLTTLDFSLSHGHLFDPSNLMSTLSVFAQRGRKITLRIGEMVGGHEYWQNQGTFVIVSAAISYQRGSYPVIKISCEDFRTLWQDGKITASDYYADADPVDVIDGLLDDFSTLESSERDIPTTIGDHNIYHQFIDQTLEDMLSVILDHFNYFSIMDVDGKYSVREIDLDQSPGHIYADDQLINYTPDDDFATWTNQVLVKGEGNESIEVLYDMESVGTLAGTTGWWGKKEVNKVWYSEDHVRTCRDPQLEILESVKDFRAFGIKWSRANEYISDVDADEQWVEITIEAPNLVGLFIGIVAAIISVGTGATLCDRSQSCGPWIFALSLECQLLGYLLGCVASYNYEIYAKPIGNIKQTFQATADDLEFQRKIGGQVITEEIDDPLCYTVQSCQTVADQELAIVHAQRNRVSFSKTAHLQDEIGDVIQITHPYSGNAINIFITNITRTYDRPGPGYNSSGGVTDKIEGWRV